MTHPTNPAYDDQTYMVEFEVPGALDGLTLSPEIRAPSSTQDPQSIYRPEVPGNLGLIDPDYVVEDGLDQLGTRGNRFIGVVWIDASVAGDVGAVIEVVDAVDGTVLVQEQIAPLAGLTTYYNKEGFVVPQGSLIRISGFPAGLEPHRVRLFISALTEKEVVEVQAENGGGGGGSDIEVLDDNVLIVANADELNFTGDGVVVSVGAAGRADVDIPDATQSWSETLQVGNLSVGGGTDNPTIATGDSILAETDNDPSLGTISERFRSTVSRVSLAVAVAGAGTSSPAYGANSVGSISGVGYAVDPAAIAQIQIANPASPQQSAVRAQGVARADIAGSIARVYASGVGASAQGYARAQTADSAQIRATGDGSFASGYVGALSYDSTILASGVGSYAGGYAKSYSGAGYGTTTIQATERGSWAFGSVAYEGEITSSGRGSSAGGFAAGGPFVQGNPGRIQSTGIGGWAHGAAEGGDLQALGLGSLAAGSARTSIAGPTAEIQAHGAGCWAGGRAQSGIIEAGYGPSLLGPFPGALAFGRAIDTIGGGIAPAVRALSPGAVALGQAAGPNALVYAYNLASLAMGTALTLSATSYAEIRTMADESGCFAGGHAGANNGNTGRISSENDGAFAWGVAVADNDNAYIRSAANGSSAFGGAANGGQNISSGPGSLTHGYARGTYVGGASPAYLVASGDGAVAFGLALADTGHAATIRSQATGSLAGGHARTNGGTALIEAGGAGPGYAGKGSFAWGYASSGGTLSATALGSHAQGTVMGGRAITASGDGSLAHGVANSAVGGADITASGSGAVAMGNAYNGPIVASGRNTVQFGVGSNAEIDSVRIGTAGLHFKGSAGVFAGGYANGQFWINNNNIYCYSGGSVQNLTNVP